ncbi:Uncharacterized protein HZ326_5217 [Fusarium oxysporum f. sp. albedinis]|nr:Uncharacterized protein HZ326_5217 [Fusarium oxysporum f. sp. albedinis]
MSLHRLCRKCWASDSSLVVVTLPRHQQQYPADIPDGRLPKSLTPLQFTHFGPIRSRLFAYCPCPFHLGLCIRMRGACLAGYVQCLFNMKSPYHSLLSALLRAHNSASQLVLSWTEPHLLQAFPLFTLQLLAKGLVMRVCSSTPPRTPP